MGRVTEAGCPRSQGSRHRPLYAAAPPSINTPTTPPPTQAEPWDSARGRGPETDRMAIAVCQGRGQTDVTPRTIKLCASARSGSLGHDPGGGGMGGAQAAEPRRDVARARRAHLSSCAAFLRRCRRLLPVSAAGSALWNHHTSPARCCSAAAATPQPPQPPLFVPPPQPPLLSRPPRPPGPHEPPLRSAALSDPGLALLAAPAAAFASAPSTPPPPTPTPPLPRPPRFH